MSDIDDDFDDDSFEEDADAQLVDETKAKPLEKRLKIDALLEQQRLKKLQLALEQEDDFAEFDLDESYINSLKYALYSMSTIGSKILKHSVVHEIDRIGEIVEELEKRNNPIPEVKINVVPKVTPQKKAHTVEVPADFKNSKEGVRIKNPIDLSDIEEFIY